MGAGPAAGLDAGEEPDVAPVEDGVDRAHLRIGLGGDETGEAVAGAAPDASTRARILLVDLDSEGDRKGL